VLACIWAMTYLGRGALRKDRLTRKSAPTTPLPLPSAIACCDDDFEALRLPGYASPSDATTNTVRSLMADGLLEASVHAAPSILAEHRPSNDPARFSLSAAPREAPLFFPRLRRRSFSS
jgi:hypothetical protein